MMYFSYLEMNYFCGGWKNDEKQNNTPTFSFENQNILMNCSDAH